VSTDTEERASWWCENCYEPLVFRDGQTVHMWSGNESCTYRSWL
jgi:hypothetical protein